MVIVGLVKLSHRRDDGRRRGGWWVVFGAAMLLNQMRVLRFGARPLFVVAFGVSIVWKMRPRARVE